MKKKSWPCVSRAKLGLTKVHPDFLMLINPSASKITVPNRTVILFDLSLTVKAARHECVIRTSQP